MKFDLEFVIWLTLAIGVGFLAARAQPCNCSSNPAPKDFTSDLYL